MKRIRKIVASALMLMMSIFVMCVGVYAAASAPKVSVSGTISYDAGACKVRVIGNLSGAYTDANGSGVNALAKTATDNNSQPCHYYGVHDNAQSATNMLPAWNIGSVYFKETASGAETFVISLKVENLSAYPIKATVNTTATESATNITKTIENNGAYIAVGGNAEILVKYDVTNSSQATTLTIGNELVFEKTMPQPEPTLEGWTAELNDGELTLVKYSGTETEIVIPSELEYTDGKTYPVTGLKSTINMETGEGDMLFANYDEENDEFISNITSITIPNSIKTIGYGAFIGCVSLTSIEIPSGVANIGEFAFYCCFALKDIVLPNSLRSIGKDSFCGCTSLTSINIPSGVTTIGYGAFSDCSSLTKITIYATTPPTIDSSTFPDGVTNIYVPASAVYDYKTASGWSDFASKISAIA